MQSNSQPPPNCPNTTTSSILAKICNDEILVYHINEQAMPNPTNLIDPPELLLKKAGGEEDVGIHPDVLTQEFHVSPPSRGSNPSCLRQSK
jgi:hypothetical protein